MWQTLDNLIDWFVLREGRYERLLPDAAGVYKSEMFPGLWLDSTAMTHSDLATVLKVLGEGLATVEHQEFVMSMKRKVPGKDTPS